MSSFFVCPPRETRYGRAWPSASESGHPAHELGRLTVLQFLRVEQAEAANVSVSDLRVVALLRPVLEFAPSDSEPSRS